MKSLKYGIREFVADGLHSELCFCENLPES